MARLERVVRRPASGPAAPRPRWRRSPTGRPGGRAARSRRRSPPRPSAPRSRGCRRGRGAGCAASGGCHRRTGSTPCLVTLVPCHSSEAWAGLVDDAAIFPPGDAPLHEATAAYGARSAEDGAELVGELRAARHRPAAGARRRDAAVGRGAPEVPASSPGPIAAEPSPRPHRRRAGDRAAGPRRPGRQRPPRRGGARRASTSRVPVLRRAARRPSPTARLAGRGRRRRRGRAAAQVPHRRPGGVGVPAARRSSPSWIDAALDRETPFKCTAGLHRAVRHTGEDGFEHHGFLNVLRRDRGCSSTAPRPTMR